MSASEPALVLLFGFSMLIVGVVGAFSLRRRKDRRGSEPPEDDEAAERG